MDSDTGPGMQARKKLKAMHRIQEAALDLFEAHGFDQVAMEAVAAAADVSPRTVYRYFGTKEMLVIWDEGDEQPPSPLTAYFGGDDPLRALRDVLTAAVAAMGEDDLRQAERRLSLVYANPAVEAAFILHAYEKSRGIAAALAADEDRFETQVFVHAFVGALVGAMRHWWRSGFDGPPFAFIDRALTLLEHGFAPAGP
ncbi:transcriptional regulator, TetR family [Glycomyces sambucus]|uniref:Transcriptional regulator, TetR family n=1 Tax=Glycomyces sambucus TaxID=380244 RepID=A0A1G9I408_9ACTN|nr:TetR family transcriptional regulator [Glycomyces sambucus]SDL19978.1 transcriptional regulator, TetR family [Glycomyces sambucus]